ncbi:unnamed protein product [Caenorhabditis nigoni]
MEPSEPILFFAARRGYYTDGVSFIVIVGLSPHEDKWYRVTERKLTERGISLGNFLLATIVSSDVVKNFKLTNYSLEVKVEENIASVIVPTDKLVPCNDGTVGFRTKPFGIVISVDKNMKPGNYLIKITSESVPGEKERDCHPLRLLCNLFRDKKSLSSSIKRSPLRAEVIPRTDPQDSNAYENYPQPASRTSSTKYTSVSTVTNKSIYETASVHSKVSEGDIYRPSNRTMSDAESIEDLIAQLPDLKPPMPLPRTVKPEETQATPIKNVVVGGGFAVKVPEDPKKQMIAFVTNVHIVDTNRLHFLWICDIQEEAVLRSPKYDLDKGHFFEGIFVCKNKKWICVKYLNEVEPLIEGSLIREKIELTLPVLSYQGASETSKFPLVYAEYIGRIIDKNFRLPANCVGRQITVERWRGDDNSYFWFVTGILDC